MEYFKEFAKYSTKFEISQYMNEKISIIIPSYNSETSIERCVRSAALQSYADAEIIVVDDASTDGTPKVLASLEKEIPGLRVICKEKNGGVSAARNTGIEAAAGKWLVTLDGDDYIEKGMLEALYTAAHRICGSADFRGSAAEKPATAGADPAAAEMTVCGIRLVWPDHAEVIEAPAEEKLPADEFLSRYMCTLWDTHLLTTHANKLYDLELIKRENLRYREDLRINEDIDFVFRYLAHCQSIAMTKGAYMNYVQHDAGKSNITTYRENGLSSSLTVLEDFLQLAACLPECDSAKFAAKKACQGALTEECLRGMDRRLFVHILSFAGLMYKNSTLSNAEKLAELTKTCSSGDFRTLASLVQPGDLKERIAAFLLKNGQIRLYDVLCRLIYK